MKGFAKIVAICATAALITFLGWAVYLTVLTTAFHHRSFSESTLSLVLRESEALATRKEETLVASDWPKEIASLKPQFVSIDRDDVEGAVVDIQLLGGFNHQGLLVVCDPKSPFIPSKSNWRITKLKAQIFYYEE